MVRVGCLNLGWKMLGSHKCFNIGISNIFKMCDMYIYFRRTRRK